MPRPLLVADPSQVDAVAVAIRDHLRRSPWAADSTTGVARGWLGADFASVPFAQMERALALLASRQALRRMRWVDGALLNSHAVATDV